VPHLDLVSSACFTFPTNEFNVSPFTKHLESNMVTVSLSSIAAVCNLDRETTASILKDIFCKFIEHARKARLCKLDLKIGNLIAYPNGSLQFENYSDFSQPPNEADDRFNKRMYIDHEQ
jgi:hypothetical protein